RHHPRSRSPAARTSMPAVNILGRRRAAGGGRRPLHGRVLALVPVVALAAAAPGCDRLSASPLPGGSGTVRRHAVQGTARLSRSARSRVRGGPVKSVEVRRLPNRFGSDHYPLLASISF